MNQKNSYAPRLKAAPWIRQVGCCAYPVEECTLKPAFHTKIRKVLVVSKTSKLHGVYAAVPASEKQQKDENAMAQMISPLNRRRTVWVVCNPVHTVSVSTLASSPDRVSRVLEEEFVAIIRKNYNFLPLPKHRLDMASVPAHVWARCGVQTNYRFSVRRARRRKAARAVAFTFAP